ncbi:MAG: SWIB/MDM2 domain-containing protein, partial [Halobacteriovoraceae bacterium]|nr:SWIB/MDM2 domain-containing protein [Halobacteriovoraceae bacterium]
TRRKAAAKKGKSAKRKSAKRPLNKAFMRPLKPSSELGQIVGKNSIPRTQAIKKVWSYIKRNSLQNPKNRRNILADTKLRPIFGKPEVTMFELTALVSKHLN